MTVLVTGGCGYIGAHVVHALHQAGEQVVVVDDLSYGKPTRIEGSRLYGMDIAAPGAGERLAEIMKAEGVDSVIHFAARKQVGESVEKPLWYYQQNINGMLNVLIGMRDSGAKKLVFSSSAATYGGRTSDFIESREYEKPLNVYGYSKFLFDEYVRQILPEANSQIVGFRYFNVYGPREGHKGSMASVAFHLNTQLNNGESPKLFEGSENFKRDFVYVGDVADVNLWFLENGVSGIFNLGTGRAESFQAVADATLAYHKKGQIEYIPFPDKLKGRYQAFTQADLTNLRAAGYDKPFKTVAEGVTEYMAWLNRDA